VENAPVVLYRKKACPHDIGPVRSGGLRRRTQEFLCSRCEAINVAKEIIRGINVGLGGFLPVAVLLNEINEAVKRSCVV
jgi:hypothetical protein